MLPWSLEFEQPWYERLLQLLLLQHPLLRLGGSVDLRGRGPGTLVSLEGTQTRPVMTLRAIGLACRLSAALGLQALLHWWLLADDGLCQAQRTADACAVPQVWLSSNLGLDLQP